MPIINALDPLFSVVVAARDNDVLWRPLHDTGKRWPAPTSTDAERLAFLHGTQRLLLEAETSEEPTSNGARAEWKQIGSHHVEGEVVETHAFCVSIPDRFGWNDVLELKVMVTGRLVLTLRRAAGPGTYMPRNRRAGVRGLLRDMDSPWSAVLLVPDDAELRALVALRCLQQNYKPTVAWEELARYARTRRVPERAVGDVLSRVFRNFVSQYRPGALPAYIRHITTALLAEEAAAREDGTVLVASVLSVPDAARQLGVGRRTLFTWIKEGVARPVETRPYRLSHQEINRLREMLDKRQFYKDLAKLRGCSDAAAAMWLSRRRAKGLSDAEILREAGGLERRDGEPAWQQEVDREREAFRQRQAREDVQSRTPSGMAGKPRIAE